MKPPLFWQNPPSRPGLWSYLLSPLAAIYSWVGARRLEKGTPLRLSVPVICVGNVNLGGTGKTPTVIALVQTLSEMGVKAHVVTRGYGGKLQGPVQVNERAHSADDVGDEPLLLAAFAPVWVSKDRATGGQAAVDAGADIIILDDGLQNPALVKDFTVLVVDAVAKFGNGKVFPSGPLRETVSTGLKRCNMVMAIGPETARAGMEFGSVPVIGAELKALATGMDWQGQRVLAFAGIGRPEKFFETLDAQGAEIVGTQALDDHERLSDSLLVRLEYQANKMGAQLVTTEKDAARLPTDWRTKVLTLPVRLELDAPEQLKTALAEVIKQSLR